MKYVTYNKKGFTLAELMIVALVFSLVVATAIGLLTTALRLQRKSIGIQNVQDNGRYIMSFIAKEIRMSEIKNASDGEAMVLVIDSPQSDEDVTYSFTGAQITRKAYIWREKGQKYDWVTTPISSDQVNVEGKFIVDGRTEDDYEQPHVTIVMKVKTIGAKAEEQTEINLQTTLSQRNLE